MKRGLALPVLLHQCNANTGPWKRISTHPVEHVIYVSVFLIWWVVPIHPVLLIMTGFYQGVRPAIFRSGFNRINCLGAQPFPLGTIFINCIIVSFTSATATCPRPRIS